MQVWSRRQVWCGLLQVCTSGGTTKIISEWREVGDRLGCRTFLVVHRDKNTPRGRRRRRRRRRSLGSCLAWSPPCAALPLCRPRHRHTSGWVMAKCRRFLMWRKIEVFTRLLSYWYFMLSYGGREFIQQPILILNDNTERERERNNVAQKTNINIKIRTNRFSTFSNDQNFTARPENSIIWSRFKGTNRKN